MVKQKHSTKYNEGVQGEFGLSSDFYMVHDDIHGPAFSGRPRVDATPQAILYLAMPALMVD